VQLSVEVPNDSLMIRIISILEGFKSEGVKLTVVDKTAGNAPASAELEAREVFSFDDIKENWKNLAMATNSVDLDDDERLFDAAVRFYNEKHSN
jgi:hypothetical protein